MSKLDRESAPILAILPPRLIEGGYATASMLTDILTRKYVDHLPLHRQEQILRTRFGIELSRKTMSDWVRIAADWLGPIYRKVADELRPHGYLQVDETPVRYARQEGGGSGQGYFWVYHHPKSKTVLYEWHTGRRAECLDKMLKGFRGKIQTDGYVAYTCYAQAHREEVELVGCWAHVRRKFFEAKDESPRLARALQVFAAEDKPQGQRLREGMECLKGLRLSDLPMPVQNHIDASMGAVNDILAGYKIETWEDYRQITLADFIRIHRIFIELAFNA